VPFSVGTRLGRLARGIASGEHGLAHQGCVVDFDRTRVGGSGRFEAFLLRESRLVSSKEGRSLRVTSHNNRVSNMSLNLLWCIARCCVVGCLFGLSGHFPSSPRIGPDDTSGDGMLPYGGPWTGFLAVLKSLTPHGRFMDECMSEAPIAGRLPGWSRGSNPASRAGP
jgi:hypothetical protein